MGDLAQAEAAFRRALDAQPNSVTARQYLGGLLADQGRGEEAEQVLREALALNPRDRRQIATLQQFLGVALKHRLKETLQLFDAAGATQPDIPTVDHCRGLTLQDMGDMEGAIRSYRRALGRNPLNMVAQQEMNKLLYRMGRDDEFLKSLDEASAKNPTAASPVLLKADFLFKTGKLPQAAVEFERAAKLARPNSLFSSMLYPVTPQRFPCYLSAASCLKRLQMLAFSPSGPRTGKVSQFPCIFRCFWPQKG